MVVNATNSLLNGWSLNHQIFQLILKIIRNTDIICFVYVFVQQQKPEYTKEYKGICYAGNLCIGYVNSAMQ